MIYSTASTSAAERVGAAALAAFAVFIVAYSATRAFLSSATPTDVDVLPHQAELWENLGR